MYFHMHMYGSFRSAHDDGSAEEQLRNLHNQDGDAAHLLSTMQEVLTYTRMLTDDMASLRTQVTNLKYDSHLLYKQACKRRQNKTCIFM